MEAANSIMLYGSEIWAKTLEVKKWEDSLVSAQRTAALGIVSACDTVSSPAPQRLYLLILYLKIYKEKSVGNHITDYFREDTIT